MVNFGNEVLINQLNDWLIAKGEILKAAQKDTFSREMGMLRPFQQGQDGSSVQQKNRTMKATGSLYRLDPFLDQDGVLRVGGRIQRGHFTHDTKFPRFSIKVVPCPWMRSEAMDTGLLAAHQLWHPKLQIVLPTGSYEEQSRSRKCQTC